MNEYDRARDYIIDGLLSNALHGTFTSEQREITSKFLENNKLGQELILEYFNELEYPFFRLMNLVGLSIPESFYNTENCQAISSALGRFEIPFYSSKDENKETNTLINACLSLYVSNSKPLAMELSRYTGKKILLDVYGDFIAKNELQKQISTLQKIKASKPRNQYFHEVMKILELTWHEYPNASKTGIHDELCKKYQGKVSKNTLLKWINESDLIPEKPKRYGTFKLCLPQ